MTKRVSGALFFAIILCISVAAFVSFGFAAISDGYAVELIDWSTNDDVLDPPDWDKDVAWCEGELQDTDGDDLDDNFEFAIHNGYPGYECQVTLVVRNAGDNTFDIVNINIAPVGTSDITIVIYEPATP